MALPFCGTERAKVDSFTVNGQQLYAAVFSFSILILKIAITVIIHLFANFTIVLA